MVPPLEPIRKVVAEWSNRKHRGYQKGRGENYKWNELLLQVIRSYKWEHLNSLFMEVVQGVRERKFAPFGIPMRRADGEVKEWRTPHDAFEEKGATLVLAHGEGLMLWD